MAGLLDMFMPNGGGLLGAGRDASGGLLDPEIEKLYHRERFGQTLNELSRMFYALSGMPAYAIPQPRQGMDYGDLLRLQEYRRRRQEEDARGANYAATVGGYDPTSGINWEQGRTAMGPAQARTAEPGPQPAGLLDIVPTQQEVNPAGGLLSGLTEMQQGLLRSLPAEQGAPALLKFAMTPPTPPTMRNFAVGDETVTRQWDPASRSWIDVESAPRWKPSERGGLTAAQEANNAEIDAARQALQSQAPTADDLERMTAPATATGRVNNEYKEAMAQIARRAFQRKVGDDLEFDSLYRRYYGAPPPETPEPQGFGQLEGYGAGPTPRPTPPIPTRRPDRGGPGMVEAPGARPSPVSQFAMPGPGGEGRLPSKRQSPARRAETRTIASMSRDEIRQIIETRGEELTPAELRLIDQRLRNLGYD